MTENKKIVKNATTIAVTTLLGVGLLGVGNQNNHPVFANEIPAHETATTTEDLSKLQVYKFANLFNHPTESGKLVMFFHGQEGYVKLQDL